MKQESLDRIRELMNQNSISLRKMEELTGISRQTIFRYLNNVNDIPSDNLSKIADALNTSVEYIRYGYEIYNNEDEVLKYFYESNFMPHYVMLTKDKNSLLKYDLAYFYSENIIIPIEYKRTKDHGYNFFLSDEYIKECDNRQDIIERVITDLNKCLSHATFNYTYRVISTTELGKDLDYGNGVVERILKYSEELNKIYKNLNDAGQEKLLDYARDLEDNAKYRKG